MKATRSWLQNTFKLVVPRDEGHTDDVRPTLHRNPQLEVGIPCFQTVFLPLRAGTFFYAVVPGVTDRRRSSVIASSDRKRFDPFAIDANLEFVRFTESSDEVVELPLQCNLDPVLTIQRKAMTYCKTAS